VDLEGSVERPLRQFFLARQFPCLRVFPGDVDGVVEMQQQAFAAVEETQAEDLVVEEGCEWA
jgi:hypothetical protein